MSALERRLRAQFPGADENEIHWLLVGHRIGATEERDACAKIADRESGRYPALDSGRTASTLVANTIRARGSR